MSQQINNQNQSSKIELEPKNPQKTLKINKSANNIIKNDFSYPFPNRKDLMYLSKITNEDYPLRKFKQLDTKRDWSMNLFNLDIAGSQPRKFGIFTNKFDFTNKNSDIEKSSPSPQFSTNVNKPQYNLRNDDIELSQPCFSNLKITRHINPLNPVYNLPKYEEYPPTPPKFLRNSMSVSDIKGTKPFNSKKFLRNTLDKSDIKEACVKMPYLRNTKYDNMNYNDVTKAKEFSKRNINPLDPIYYLNEMDDNNNKKTIGPIEGNKSVVFSKYRYSNPYNLRNDDILGAKADTKNKIKIFRGSNSCYNISDIKGAQHDTLLKGISTKRKTNPLMPIYKFPGSSECSENNEIGNKNNNEKIENNNINKINEKEKNNNNNKETFDTNTEKNNVEVNNKAQEEKLDQILSELNKLPKNDNNLFDKNVYKKPDIFYGLKHDDNLLAQHQRNDVYKLYNPKLRTFQQVIDGKIELKKQNILNGKSRNDNLRKSYECQMDDFLVRTKLNQNETHKRLEKNIYAYYDIGLQEELKAPESQYFKL